MEAKALSGILTVLLITVITLNVHVQPAKADCATIVVPEDCTTIQQAIDNAHPGDTIYVRNGTYRENLVLNKPNLTLLGENRDSTVIDGSRFAVSIEADNIRVSGLTIGNGYIGVRMSPWTHGHVICGNKIQNNDEGVSGHYDVWGVAVHDNQITMNDFVGINLVFYDSVVSYNLISNNGKGDFVAFTAGILVGEGVNNKTISSNNNVIIGNVIKDNFNGVSIVRYSEDNVFRHNTFQNNTNHMLLSASSSISVEENFWSEYAGEDNDGDGVGDTPYILSKDVRDASPLMSPFSYWRSPMEGDLNRDMKVDVRDLAIAAEAFGSYIGHERWKMQADVHQDGRVDIRDMVAIAKNFGKICL